MSGFINLGDSLRFNQDKEVIYRNRLNIKCKGVWKANTLIEKQDKICEKHDLYSDELHSFPTGKIQWLGCPKCREFNRQKEIALQIKSEMAQKGMVWDEESKRFIDKNPQAANDEQPKVTKFRYKS